MLRIGISGWNYKGWRGVFYPDHLPKSKELAYASSTFNSIEINSTFYSLKSQTVFKKWYAATPKNFQFSVKGSRFITHIKRLKDVEGPLANFFASGVLFLGEKLGPFLWQLPPNFRFDGERLRQFFQLLPKNTKEAECLAGRSDNGEKNIGTTPSISQIRHCLEVRNHSFMVSQFFELLREFNIAFVIADTGGKWPYAEDITADFVYIRLHGPKELYVSGYSVNDVKHWADRIRCWSVGKEPVDAILVSKWSSPRTPKDLYVYFDNDAKVKAPYDAKCLIKELKVPSLKI